MDAGSFLTDYVKRHNFGVSFYFVVRVTAPILIVTDVLSKRYDLLLVAQVVALL